MNLLIYILYYFNNINVGNILIYIKTILIIVKKIFEVIKWLGMTQLVKYGLMETW